MPDAQPAPMGGPLPRGHLLALNRSFRRTLEAENKSPRTVEAYTDAVRFLARYCEAHGKPLLAHQLREHIQDFIADQLARWKPTTAHNRYRGLHAFFKWAVAEGDLQSSPVGRHATAPAARATGRRGPGRAANSATQDLRGAGLHQPPRHRHHPAAGRHRDAPGPVRRHDPGRCRPGPAEPLGAGQGSTTPGAADRSQDRPGTGPLLEGARGTSAGPPAAPVGRPQWPHDPLGDLPGRP
jgi:Phage integrase, N-terminal SAM-like domain